MLFEKVSFRVTTPAPVIVTANFFLDRFTYFFFFVLFLWKLSKKRCHRFFFIPFQRLVAIKQSQGTLKNTCFCTFGNISEG